MCMYGAGITTVIFLAAAYDIFLEHKDNMARNYYEGRSKIKK